MPEISTAGIFQAAFIARHMEQTPRAFFQTTFESIGRVCAARHARGELELQGKWRTRACVPHTPYHAGYGLLAGNPGSPLQPLVAAINCTLWVAYGFLKEKRDYPVMLANAPGIILGLITFVTSF